MDNEQLKQVGLKVTLPRVKIIQILENSQTRHLSAEDISKALTDSGEEVALGTIYRVLAQFETAGLVTRHHFEGGYSVFELNEGEHHDHLVCIKCGLVKEFVDEVIEERQHSIAKKAGFKMTDHSLNIYGLCSKCR